MDLLIPFLVLVFGFIVLVKGADLFVDGASSIARFFKVSPLITGLTVVAFGTSLPEAAVSITSAIKGVDDVAFGNVVGSNISGCQNCSVVGLFRLSGFHVIQISEITRSPVGNKISSRTVGNNFR